MKVKKSRQRSLGRIWSRAILYAEKQEKTLIVEENMDSCFVFKANLIDLCEEAKQLLNDADMNSRKEQSACFGCGVICENISRCASCKLAKYCSKECQAKCWKLIHKSWLRTYSFIFWETLKSFVHKVKLFNV
jgi:hypothetical protein